MELKRRRLGTRRVPGLARVFYEGAWEDSAIRRSRVCFILCCCNVLKIWTCGHDNVLLLLQSICNDAGFATNHKQVLTSEGNRRAYL